MTISSPVIFYQAYRNCSIRLTVINDITVKRPAYSEQLDERTWFLEDSGKQREIICLIAILFTARDAQASEHLANFAVQLTVTVLPSRKGNAETATVRL
jgi:hypothetical protein